MVARTSSVLTLVLAMALPAPAWGQGDDRRSDEWPGIVGMVVDRETRRPIDGVAIRLDRAGADEDTLPLPAPVLTDETGQFAFTELPDADYRMEFARLGYQTVVDSVTFRAAFGLRIQVEMAAEAVELEPLFVVTEVRSRTLDASGFYDRRRGGIGRFLTRDEILDRRPMRTSDIFRFMPGVRMSSERFGRDAVVLLRGGCVPDVFLDGIRTSKPFPVDALLVPDHLAGVEVYHSSEVPSHYGPSNCGAVLIWTYVPNPRSGGGSWSWTKFLFGAGILGTVIFLTR